MLYVNSKAIGRPERLTLSARAEISLVLLLPLGLTMGRSLEGAS